MAGINDKRWSDEEVEKLKELYASGLSDDAVAEKLGRSENSVRKKYSRIYGVYPHRGGRKETIHTKDGKDMDASKYTLIDTIKFESIIRKKGIKKTGISRDLGFSDSTVSNWAKSGYFPKSVILLLDSIYGIKFEDIKPEEKEEPVQEATENTTSPVDIEFAFYKACVKAFDRFAPQMEEMIYRAVVRAEEDLFVEKKGEVK